MIWSDGLGLHLNVRPRNGCGDWASSEAWHINPLGYGTYTWHIVGPLNTLDFQVTLGAFTWDDDW